MSAQRRRNRDAREAADAAPRPVEADVTPADLAALLEGMRELRLTLAADLSAAAGAADAGNDDVVAEILTSDQREVAAFSRRSRDLLAALDHAATALPDEDDALEPVPSGGDMRWRRRALVALPTVPLVGALAMTAAAAMGVLPLPAHSHHRTAPRVVADAPAPVATTFNALATVLAHDPSESQVVAAASALHRQLEELIATAPSNPAHVDEVAKVLQLEQALLMRAQPPGSARVLAASRRLEKRLLVVVESTAPAAHPSAPAHKPSPAPTRDASASPAPSATPTHTPSPTHSSSPRPTTWPTPSASPSSTSSPSPGHLPTLTH